MKEFQFYKDDSHFYKGFDLALKHEQGNATGDKIIKDISDFIRPLDDYDKDLIDNQRFENPERVELDDVWFNYGNRAYYFEVDRDGLLLVSSVIVSDDEWDNANVYIMDSKVTDMKDDEFKKYIAEWVLFDYKDTKGACDYERYAHPRVEIDAYEKFLDKYAQEHGEGQYPPSIGEFRTCEFADPECREYYGLEEYFKTAEECLFNPQIEEWKNNDKHFESLDGDGYSISIHEVLSWLSGTLKEYESAPELKSKELTIPLKASIGDMIVRKCTEIEDKYSLDLFGEIMLDDDYEDNDKNVLSLDVTNDLIVERLLYWELADLIDEPKKDVEVDYDANDNIED